MSFARLRALPFRRIPVIDFEYQPAPDEVRISKIHCLVARDALSGECLRLWGDEFVPGRPPFDTGPETLVVAYAFTIAEGMCFAELGWPMPVNVIDLYAEHCNDINGELDSNVRDEKTKAGPKSLLSCAAHNKVVAISAAEKSVKRDLAIRGGPYNEDERRELIAYCESDVELTVQVLAAMYDKIFLRRGRPLRQNLMHALLRGRYAADCATIQHRGIGIDVPAYNLLVSNWGTIQSGIVSGSRFASLYKGTSLDQGGLARLVQHHKLEEAWPRTATDRLSAAKDVLKDMARIAPDLSELYEVASTLGLTRFSDIAVHDGRHHCRIRPFGTKTSRNAPTRSLFGAAVWMRNLIVPSPGYALAYLDWSGQEYAICAAFSGDPAMMADYLKDPHMQLAIRTGRAPPDATRETHGLEREMMKSANHGINYGMGAHSLGARLGGGEGLGSRILREYQMAYPVLWRWRARVRSRGNLQRWLETVFGWQMHVRHWTRSTTLMNFPVQGNGAEMLRLAVIRAAQRGVRVLMPVHDALLIEAPAGEIGDVVEQVRRDMVWASAQVLDGFEIGVDAKVFGVGERYSDPRGKAMWARVQGLLAHL